MSYRCFYIYYFFYVNVFYSDSNDRLRFTTPNHVSSLNVICTRVSSQSCTVQLSSEDDSPWTHTQLIHHTWQYCHVIHTRTCSVVIQSTFRAIVTGFLADPSDTGLNGNSIYIPLVPLVYFVFIFVCVCVCGLML